MPRNFSHFRWLFAVAVVSTPASGGDAEPVTLRGKSHTLSFPHIGSGMAVLRGQANPDLRLEAVLGQTGDRDLAAPALHLEGGVLHRSAIPLFDSIFADGFEGDT